MHKLRLYRSDLAAALIIPRIILIFATLLLTLQLAQAQFFQQGPKLLGIDGVGQQSRQGWSVSVSADGNTAIVGGYGDNGNIGAAWAYTRSAGVWTQQGPKLTGFDCSYGSGTRSRTRVGLWCADKCSIRSRNLYRRIGSGFNGEC
jgi:hypothetical protein